MISIDYTVSPYKFSVRTDIPQLYLYSYWKHDDAKYYLIKTGGIKIDKLIRIILLWIKYPLKNSPFWCFENVI